MAKLDRVTVALFVGCVCVLIALICLGEEDRPFWKMQLLETRDEFLRAPPRRRGKLLYGLDFLYILMYSKFGLRTHNNALVLTGVFDLVETSIAL